MTSRNNTAAQTAEKQRDIQQQVAASDRKQERQTEGASKTGAMQAGARVYPVPPFPKQHQPKPGAEHKLDPAPLYEAPFYRGSGKLEERWR